MNLNASEANAAAMPIPAVTEFDEMRHEAATTFLRGLFEPNDTVCVWLIRQNPDDPKKSENDWFIRPLEQIAEPGTFAQLDQKQRDCWNVYVCMNPLKPGSKRRLKENVAEIRTAYIDIDHDGPERLAQLTAAVKAGEIPAPRFVVQSSPKKYHVTWRLIGATPEQQEELNKRLVAQFDADPNAKDCVRVLRVPGFSNLKYAEQPLVVTLRYNAGQSTLDGFKLSLKGVSKPDTELKSGDTATNGSRNESWMADSIPVGKRNSSLHAIAGGLREFGLPIEAVRGAVYAINDEQCDVPLDSDEVDTLIESAAKYPVGRTTLRMGGVPADGPDAIKYRIDSEIKAAATTSTSSAPSTAGPVRELTFVRGDSVKPVRLKWLWRNRILAEKLNVFSGEPDVGKGMTTVDFAARISRQMDFPDCKNELDGPKDVLFLSSEDDMADTVIPRLSAAGADMARIHFAEITENISGTKQEGLVSLDSDIPTLEAMIQANPNIVLVVIDPIIAFLGSADPNKDKDVRPIYSRLKIMTSKTGVACLAVNHWNKNQQATSINRTSGAKTMVSAPRMTWMMAKDPNDPTRYLMMRGKGNLSRNDVKTLAYRIVGVPFDFGDGRPPDPDGVPKLVWEGETDHSCEDVLQEAVDPKRRSAKAEELIISLLADGAMKASDIYQAGLKGGFSDDKMKRARQTLEYPVEQIDRRWYWAKNTEDLAAVRAKIYTSVGVDLGPKTIN